MGPLVLLPLNAQKEKHFEEKFAKEKNTTFWYQDERNIVSLLVVNILQWCTKKWDEAPLK